MKKRVLYIILSLLVVIEGSFLFLTYKSYNNKSEVDKQEIKETIFNNRENSIAIKVEDDNSPGTYKDYDRNTWPDKTTYSYYRHECYDGNETDVTNNGVFTFNEDTFTANVKTTTSLYCTLYFVKNYDALDLLKDKPGFETEANMIARCDDNANFATRCDTVRRFQGNNTTVTNNYICFGSDEVNDCAFETKTGVDQTKVNTNLDKYAYRIIGIDTQTKELKLIKMQALNTAQVWHSTTGDSYTWNNSQLYKRLNGLDSTKIFLTDTTNYPYMQTNASTESNWTKLINTHTWKYGDVPNSSTGYDANTTASQMYQRGRNMWESDSNKGSVSAKIGLMYGFDYALSLGNSNKCHYQGSSSDYNQYKNSWIFLWTINDSSAPFTDREWTMTRYSSNYAWFVSNTGQFLYSTGSPTLPGAYSVRPVFYLKSDVKIHGEGSKANPFIISGVPD